MKRKELYLMLTFGILLGYLAALYIVGLQARPAKTAIQNPPLSLPEKIPLWQLDPQSLPRLVRISIPQQKLEYFENGKLVYTFICSTAFGGVCLPPDVHPEKIHNHTGVFSVLGKQKNRWSRQYHCPMPYALHYHGGHFIHATNELRKLGRPASHGCIRLHPRDAQKLYAKVALGDTIEIR